MYNTAMRRIFIITIISFLPAYHFAQKTRENADITIRGTAGLPQVISSSMFRTSFHGLFEGSLSLNYKISGHGFAGLGYLFSTLKCNEGVFIFITTPHGNVTYNTRM